MLNQNKMVIWICTCIYETLFVIAYIDVSILYRAANAHSL